MLDKPSLIVVGTGIRIIGQMTTESIAWIKAADKVFFLAYDPNAGDILGELNASAESLADLYVEGRPRNESLQNMVDRVLASVRSGKRTCMVLYGHPGVFCWPGHEAIRQARREGYLARMLAGISAEDCLFADLGIDPATHGCQSYVAIDFLKYGHQADPSSLLILWQIGVLADPVFKTMGYDLAALPLLVERLCRRYRRDHEVIVYVAPVFLAGEPVVERVPLSGLGAARLSASSTLCIPPGRPAKPDRTVYRRLNLPLPGQSSAKRLPPKRRKAASRRTPSGAPRPVHPSQPGRAR